MGLIKRWRTSRGYGVHSPFAFNLITKVLREFEANYYAYAEIDSLCPQGRRTGLTVNFSGFNYAIPDARLLFRILCRFNPAQVIEVGNGHEVTNTILERAVPSTKRLRWVSDRHLDLLPAGDSFVLLNQMRPEIVPAVRKMILSLSDRPEGVVVFMRNLRQQDSMKQMWRDLSAAMPYGMDFSNGHVGLLCILPGLPRQSYSLFF